MQASPELKEAEIVTNNLNASEVIGEELKCDTHLDGPEPLAKADSGPADAVNDLTEVAGAQITNSTAEAH
eukprot:scaffold393840_cov23-Prasinocladus_malaysianus.AAC.1